MRQPQMRPPDGEPNKQTQGAIKEGRSRARGTALRLVQRASGDGTQRWHLSRHLLHKMRHGLCQLRLRAEQSRYRAAAGASRGPAQGLPIDRRIPRGGRNNIYGSAKVGQGELCRANRYELGAGTFWQAGAMSVQTELPKRKSASHGEAGYPRRAFDFYPTEPWVTEALCREVEFDRGIVWEPACGDGRMARVLDKWSTEVVASDITDHGYGERGIDFLNSESREWLRSVHGGTLFTIITNPPFDLAKQFIARALELTKAAKGKVAVVQRHEFDAPATNRPLFELPFAAKLILHKRPRWADGTNGAPRYPFAWYLWDWRHQGPPITRWLPDPDKPQVAALFDTGAAR